MNASVALANDRSERLRFSDWLFILFVFLIHFEYLYLQMNIEDSIFKPYRILAGVCLLLYLPRLSRDFQATKKLLLPLVFVFGYGVFVTFLNLGSRGLDNTLELLLLPVTNLTMLFAAMSARSSKAIRFGLYAYCIALALNVLYGAAMFASDQYRMAGFYRNPNHLGAALGSAAIAVIYLIPKRLRLIRPIALALFFGGLALTGSRGGILATVLALIYISSVEKEARNRLLVTAVVLSVVLSVLSGPISRAFMNLSGGRLSQRYSQSEITRGAGRLQIARAALYVGKESAFVGIGIGGYTAIHLKTMRKLNLRVQNKVALGTHNFFIALLVEWGLPALIAFVVFSYRVFKTRIAQSRSLIFGLLVLYGVFGGSTDLVSVVGSWVVLGLFIKTEAIAIRSGINDPLLPTT